MEKIKQFIESDKGKDALIVAIVILVGLGSFELGRLSKASGNTGVKIEYPSMSSEDPAQAASQGAGAILSEGLSGNYSQSSPINSVGKSFFASSRGSKYYPAGCSAGKSLKQENRIYFTTKEEAERAGYELSASCKKKDMIIPKKVPENGYYYHYKHNPALSVNNYAYEVIGVGMHTEDGSNMVIYRPIYESSVFKAGKFYDLRPLEMFMENAIKDNKKISRFEKISDEKIITQLDVIKRKMYG